MNATNTTAEQQATYDAFTMQSGAAAALSVCMAVAFIVSLCCVCSVESAFRNRCVVNALTAWCLILSTGDFIYAVSVDEGATPGKLAVRSGVNYFMLAWSSLLSVLVLAGTCTTLREARLMTESKEDTLLYIVAVISGACFVASLCPTIIFGVWTSLPSA
jgi:hypothetical protein